MTKSVLLNEKIKRQCVFYKEETSSGYVIRIAHILHKNSQTEILPGLTNITI